MFYNQNISNTMRLRRTISPTLHQDFFQRKPSEYSKIYKNKQTLFPIQSSINTSKKLVNKELRPVNQVKDLNTNIPTQKKINNFITKKTSSYSKQQVPVIKIQKTREYQTLYEKYNSMIKKHQKKKNQLQKDIRQLDWKFQFQQEKYQNQIQKLEYASHQVKKLKNYYYEIRRKNLELYCELDDRGLIDHQQYERQESVYGANIDEMNTEQILLLEERMGTVNVGLSSQKISKLSQKPLKYYTMQEKQNSILNKKEDEIYCCICRQNIQLDEIVTKLQCNHLHHFECLSKWLKMKKFCPLCKGEIKAQKLVNY